MVKVKRELKRELKRKLKWELKGTIHFYGGAQIRHNGYKRLERFAALEGLKRFASLKGLEGGL